MTTIVRRLAVLLLMFLGIIEGIGSEGLAQKRVRVRLDCGKCDSTTPMVLANAGGKCLDVHAPEINVNGGRVQVWNCKETKGEYWRWDGDLLVNGGGKCLQAAPRTMNDNGGVVHVWECSSEATNQKWRMENGAIISNASGLCLDVNRPDMNRDGGRVQLWTCVPGQPPQVWQFEEFQDAR
jgi:hypothetical protein